MVDWLPGRLNSWLKLSFQSIITTYRFNWHVSALNLVFTLKHLWNPWIHDNSVAPVRQDLQTKVTNAFAHLNTGAPIVRKEMVGKKTFFIWWNIFMKISTSPFKLSIDESNCQSYSATLSSVYFSRCLNPLLSLLLSYPSVWLSGWLSSRLFFYPTHIRLLKINSPHMCWFFSQQ